MDGPQKKHTYGTTRWAPANYKWSYKPYKWPYKWVTGVITCYNPTYRGYNSIYN